MKKIILCITLLFILTGCNNYRELNDLAIVSGISIAKVDDEYELTVEVVNPKKQQDSSSSKETDFVIYKNKDSSLQEAIRKMINESPKKMYGAQIDILILDESIVKEDLTSIVDFFARDPEIRSEFYVLVGKNDSILEVITPLEKISSQNILQSLESNNNYLGSSNLVTFHDLIDNYLNDKIDLALPTIKLIGNAESGQENSNLENTTENTYHVLDNIAIFKDNKLVGYLEEEDSKVYNLLMNNLQNNLVKVEFDDDQYIINEMVNVTSKIEVNPKKKSITINVTGKASISEAKYTKDLTKSETIKKVQKKLNDYTEKIVKKSIENITKTYKSDIYGFEDMFYKKDAKYYKENLQDNWDEILENLDIKVKSTIEIIEKGNLNGGLYYEQ